MLWNEVMRDWVVGDLAAYVALISFAALLLTGFIRRSSHPVRTLIKGIVLISVLSTCILFADWLNHYVHYDSLFAGLMFLKFALLGLGTMVAFLVVRTVQIARKKPD